MPIIKSAKKRLRQSAKRHLRTQSVRTGCKTAVRKARQSIDAGAPDMGDQLRAAQGALAKAASKGIIPRTQAARRLSRIAKQSAKAAP